MRISLALHLFQHDLHLRVHEIDGLQGADHDLEFGDLALVVEGHDVDAIDILAVDL